MRYSPTEPTRAEVDALPGATIIEFGNDWCGHCQAAQPHIASALAGHSGIRHIKIADGKGQPLGRSFQIKLWPTLVFVRDGEVVAKVVRPTDANSIRDALSQLEKAA